MQVVQDLENAIAHTQKQLTEMRCCRIQFLIFSGQTLPLEIILQQLKEIWSFSVSVSVKHYQNQCLQNN